MTKMRMVPKAHLKFQDLLLAERRKRKRNNQLVVKQTGIRQDKQEMTLVSIQVIAIAMRMMN